MNLSLSERIKSYESASEVRLLGKLPIFIRLNIRSYNRVSKKLDKPHSYPMSDLLSQTLLGTISDIDNSVFGYSFYDEINIVIKNDGIKDDSTWLSNDLQKMASVASSLATYNFYKTYAEMENKPEIAGQVIFGACVFAVPNVDEAMGALIDSQNNCIINAINLLSYDFYAAKYGKSEASAFLEKKNVSDRILLLKEEFGFDLKADCKPEFLYGTTAYKVPHMYASTGGSVRKNKWLVDKNTTKFADDKNLILNILHSGHDVFRIGRDIST